MRLKIRGTLNRMVGRTSPKLSTNFSMDSATAMAEPEAKRQCSSQVWPKEWAQGRNETEMSPVSMVKLSMTPLMLETMLPWLSRTPLGLPVVPEV